MKINCTDQIFLEYYFLIALLKQRREKRYVILGTNKTTYIQVSAQFKHTQAFPKHHVI